MGIPQVPTGPPAILVDGLLTHLGTRVLILRQNEPFPYGWVGQEAKALAQAGYDVTVLCPTGLGYDEMEEVYSGVMVYRFVAPPSGRGAVGYLREYGLSMVRLWRLIRRITRDAFFDVVIVCTPPDFMVALVLSLRRRGTSVVVDARDPGPELFEAKFGRRGPLYRLLLLAERWALRLADTVTPPNEPCAELVRRRGGVDPERVFVVGSGPDPDRIFQVPPSPDLRRGRRYLVVWMGRVSEKEGLGCLVDAADYLVHRLGRTDVAFTIVGPGEINGLVADIRRRGLHDAFQVVGALTDPADVRRYLATADVCVSVDRHNAMNDRSTMMKVFEYMAMGRAVVQFPLTEMVRLCGETTLYARDGDAIDFAEKIALLLDDADRRERLEAAARRRVLDGLMWTDQVPVLIEAVETAVKRRRWGRQPRSSSRWWSDDTSRRPTSSSSDERSVDE